MTNRFKDKEGGLSQTIPFLFYVNAMQSVIGWFTYFYSDCLKILESKQ